MKSLKIAGLCLASMLVASLALAGNAMAAPAWLLCLKGSGANTKYEDSSCTKASAGGEWESVTIGAKSDTVKVQLLTILLLDTKATGGSSGVRCGHPSVGWGSVEGTLLIITSGKVANPKTECERVEGGCKAGEVEKLENVDLPWKVEGYETEGKLFAKLQADGNGEPGWEIECNTLLGKVKDKCTGGGETSSAANEVSGGVLLVLTHYLETIKGSCTQGGSNAARLVGKTAILLYTGSGLSLT